ncbi:M20 family metallopeptidase [Paenibacillus nasutitermitis]|uniref:Probable succinyl-diaminopimelate desuccinylase n=1 Tax=Paenibacillus nasutitermitis TaxID=1652958 RepID=A0A917DVU0_9BACL|nr:M20 family metallopeptidase [Paenibacillus nasutitermitis]GGD73470.1 acetylornithine deacetylase [Paenibacillus nasutitermitis]
MDFRGRTGLQLLIMEPVKINRDRLIQVLQDLVAIPSVNPAFPDGYGEAGVAAYMKQFFAELGLPTLVQEVEPGRENVIGMLQGPAGCPALLLEAHMDTVQITGMTIDPYGGEVRDGRLYGRGACDTKASLAAMMLAVEALRNSGADLPASVHLAAVVDEEYRYKGVSALAAEISAGHFVYDGAIVGEPTGLNPIIAHKGVVRFHVDVHGIAGHSSEPDKGLNAIESMVTVISYLKNEMEPAYAKRVHPLVGPPTHCISLIEGGSAPNTVPERCRITIDRRTVPGEEPLEVWVAMKRELLALEEQIPGLKLTVNDPFVIDFAMEVSAGEPLVRNLQDAVAKKIKGKTAAGAPYGSDASKLVRAGVPSVVFGPGDLAQAHTHEEWVDLDEVVLAASILADTVMNFGRE